MMDHMDDSLSLTQGITRTTAERDDRFKQLMSLIHENNQDAIGDLWREFGVAYSGDEK